MGWLDAFKKKSGDGAAAPTDDSEERRDAAGPAVVTNDGSAGGSAVDDLEARIRHSMTEDRRPTAQSADIRQVRSTQWGPARPYWVIDSTGFRRSFSQLPYGTDLKLRVHGESGEQGKAGRVRVTRDGKTVGYLSGGASKRYLPVMVLAETVDAHLTVEGVVADYHGETSLTVFLPAAEVMGGIIRNAAAAAATAGE